MKAMHCSWKTELQQGWGWHCDTGMQEISFIMQDIHRTQESHGSPRGLLDLPFTPRILYTIWAGHRHLKMSNYSIKWMVTRTRSTVGNKWRVLFLTRLVTPWGWQGPWQHVTLTQRVKLKHVAPREYANMKCVLKEQSRNLGIAEWERNKREREEDNDQVLNEKKWHH